MDEIKERLEKIERRQQLLQQEFGIKLNDIKISLLETNKILKQILEK